MLTGFACNNPGTFECFLGSVFYALILAPIQIFFGLFGYDFVFDIA